MPFPIEEKLVIAVASSALFDLAESGAVFEKRGEEAYRAFQRDHKNDALERGVAFPFIRRFLNINVAYPAEQPVEVVLLSRNDPDTGERVRRSIRSYGLNISRAAFLTGKSPYPYIPAFNVSLFLSANKEDVLKAIEAHYPAGTVLPTTASDDPGDKELRVAFDFDGVIADDEAEAVFHKGNLELFQQHETTKADIPLNPGLLNDLFRKISKLQEIERARQRDDRSYKRILRTAIVTARNAPADQRVVTTLREWGVNPDETFFLGGIEKRRILEVLKPHVFFDDQLTHLESVASNIPSVHVPFGIKNRPTDQPQVVTPTPPAVAEKGDKR